MQRRIGWWMVMSAMALGAGAAGANDEKPLSREALSRCASQMQTLRDESARLNLLNAQLDERRVLINRERAGLDAERAALSADDLAKGLEFHSRVKRQQADAVAFNGEIEQVKRDINALNRLKADYDAGCSERSYRRADLESLPQGARQAMREGMGGVPVPYIDPVPAPR